VGDRASNTWEPVKFRGELPPFNPVGHTATMIDHSTLCMMGGGTHYTHLAHRSIGHTYSHRELFGWS